MSISDIRTSSVHIGVMGEPSAPTSTNIKAGDGSIFESILDFFQGVIDRVDSFLAKYPTLNEFLTLFGGLAETWATDGLGSDYIMS